MRVDRSSRERLARVAEGAGLALLLLCTSSALSAQSVVTGVVVDSVSGTPVAGAVVFGPGRGIQTATDSTGRFRLDGLEAIPVSLFVRAYGFVPRTVDGITAEPVTIRLARAPVTLEGVEVRVTRFETRLDSIHTILDRSATGARWGYEGGVPRIAMREDIQRYDEANDPEIALAALGLFPSFDFECGWRHMGGTVRPHPSKVFVDGESHPILGCQRFMDMDVSNICRLEMISGALYAWSCDFLARVADGRESVPRMLKLVTPAWWNIGG